MGNSTKKVILYVLGAQILIMFLYMLLGEFSNSNLRVEFRNKITEFDSIDNLYLVINNDTITDNTHSLLNEFKKVKHFNAHHSSPHLRFKVTVINKNNNLLDFYFYRDSQIDHEYWIQYDDLRIGRLHSDKLNRFKSDSIGVKYKN